VAIADVSAYVQPGTVLDAEAQNRATSVYFPENVIPMLPEALSNGLCSLNPQVDRLCMVCEMKVGRDGEVAKSKFYPAVMRSRARLIYEDVAEILENPLGPEAQQRPELVAPLQTLQAVFEALFAAREKRGAIDFEGTETKIVFGAQRKIEKIVPVLRNVAHRLIEECMIAANVEAAKLVDKHQMPALYRVHAEPDADKVALLREFLAGRGLSLAGGSTPKAADYAHTLAQVKGREDATVVQSVMLRSLMQARYSPENTGHFGLALGHYAHFTSPIRRYPDLLLHRAIKHVLARAKPRTFDYSAAQMEGLGAHCSMAERRADDATRDVSTWLKCEFMRHRVGEEFAGVVTSVASFGLFIELEGLYIEGMVHVSNLGDDFYEFDARHQRLVGSRSKRVFALGERLRVRVTRVSLDERKIDLEALPARNSSGRGQSPPPQDQGGGGKQGRQGQAAGKGERHKQGGGRRKRR
jgi:ribonuclease R